MNVGHSLRLTRLEVEQAIREKALSLAKARRVVVDSIDPLDFQNRAAVHYTIAMVPGAPALDGSATQLPVVSDCVLTWED